MKVVVLVFILIGSVVILIGALLSHLATRGIKDYSHKIEGVLIDFKSYRTYDRNIFHYGVYEYIYQGQAYHITSTIGTSYRPRKGKKQTLYVNPYNPQDCVIDVDSKKFAAKICIGIGSFFVAIAIIVLVGSLF